MNLLLANVGVNVKTPHIDIYTVAACVLVAIFLVALFKKNALVIMFAIGIIVTIALHLGGAF